MVGRIVLLLLLAVAAMADSRADFQWCPSPLKATSGHTVEWCSTSAQTIKSNGTAWTCATPVWTETDPLSLPLAGGTMSGNILWADSWGIGKRVFGGTDHYMWIGDSTNPSVSEPAIAFSRVGGINLINFHAFSILWDGNTMFSANNDGAGSGLDADLLDGNNSSAFLTAETDPQVGTLTDTKWCAATATDIDCDKNPPVLTEADPLAGKLAGHNFWTFDNAWGPGAGVWNMVMFASGNPLLLSSATGISWTSTTNAYAALVDVGLKRSAVGVLQVTNGSTGDGKITTQGVGLVTGAEPACAAGIRGTIWYVAGGGGIADTVKVCAKDVGDVYAWRVLY